MGSGGSMFGVVDGIDGPQVGGSAKDWINIEINPIEEMLTRPGAKDIVHGFPRVTICSISKTPFPDNFADFVYSHHSLEHVNIGDVVPTLKEWWRILKPGGLVNINVPDLLGNARKLVETDGNLLWSRRGERDEWESGYTQILHAIYGDESTPYQHHRTGFTPAYLRQLLSESGFAVGKIDEVWDMETFCLDAWAQK